MLSYAEANVIGVTTRALMAGAYLASFLLCLRWLIFSDDGGNLRKGISWPFLIITVILFALILTDFAITVQATLCISGDSSNYADATPITVRNLTI